jgi:hypothetical protein
MKANFIKVLAAILCSTLISANVAADDSQIQIEIILKQSETLYATATHIIAVAPQTKRQVDAIYMQAGGKWQRDERAFQQVLMPMLNGAQEKYSAEFLETLIRLGQFDNFIFSAVGAIYNCKNNEAQWNLKISKELLDHARMAFNGSPKNEWSPDLDSAPKSKGEECH